MISIIIYPMSFFLLYVFIHISYHLLSFFMYSHIRSFVILFRAYFHLMSLWLMFLHFITTLTTFNGFRGLYCFFCLFINLFIYHTTNMLIVICMNWLTHITDMSSPCDYFLEHVEQVSLLCHCKIIHYHMFCFEILHTYLSLVYYILPDKYLICACIEVLAH